MQSVLEWQLLYREEGIQWEENGQAPEKPWEGCEWSTRLPTARR